MIIGLAGYAGSGKDTAAVGLIESGYERRAFADGIRDCLYALNPIVEGTTRVQELVDTLGWDVAKQEPEVRNLLQRLGTEAGRQILGDDIWINVALRPGPENIVVTDVRYPNEAIAVKARGGKVVRIERPGVEAANGHISETAMDGWGYDAVIYNTGTPGYLTAELVGLAARFAKTAIRSRQDQNAERYWEAVQAGAFRVDL